MSRDENIMDKTLFHNPPIEIDNKEINIAYRSGDTDVMWG